jgi:hypothetical protein
MTVMWSDETEWRKDTGARPGLPRLPVPAGGRSAARPFEQGPCTQSALRVVAHGARP